MNPLWGIRKSRRPKLGKREMTLWNSRGCREGHCNSGETITVAVTRRVDHTLFIKPAERQAFLKTLGDRVENAAVGGTCLRMTGTLVDIPVCVAWGPGEDPPAGPK